MMANKNISRWPWRIVVALLLAELNFCSRADEPKASTEIYALIGAPGGVALQPDGKIVIANGSYLYWGNAEAETFTFGMASSGAFRFNQDGTLDRSFHCAIDAIGFNGPQSTRLVSASDGRLLMTGPFHAVDGKSRPGYAMLLSNGQLDESFEPWRDFTNPPARNGVGAGVYGAALLSNGWASVASSMLDAPYPTAYSLDVTGRFVPPDKPSQTLHKFPNALMFTLTPTGLGIQREIDWTKNTWTKWDYWPPAHMPPGLPFPQWGEKPSALDMSEALQSIFEEVPMELCRYAVRLPDGGFILAVQEEGGSHFMRFDKNWRPDFSYTNHFETSAGSCLSLALQPDGKLLVAGKISKLNGEPFPGLIRLDQKGAIDRGFNCHAVGGIDAAVMGVALQNDGRIVIVGFFEQVNGVDCPHLARLNPDGSLDQSFQRHFTSFQNLTTSRRVKVHSLAASTLPNAVASVTNAVPVSAVEPVVQTVTITSFSVASGVAMLQFQGNANSPYILQAASDLSLPNWVNVDTNQTDSAGKGTLRDEDAKNHPVRFYRVATP